jgi:site-specific recombinase XerD
MAVSVVSSKILHNSFTKYTPNKRAFNASKQGQAGLYLEDQHMVSHRLRDTFAVSMLEHGVPMEEVARMLGNSMKVCERHYAKWVQTRQDRLDTLVVATWKGK